MRQQLQEPATEFTHHRAEVDLAWEMVVVGDQLQLRVGEPVTADRGVVRPGEADLAPELGNVLDIGVVTPEQFQARLEVVVVLAVVRQAPCHGRGQEGVDLVDRTLAAVARHVVRVVHAQFDAARGRHGRCAEHPPRSNRDSLRGLVFRELECNFVYRLIQAEAGCSDVLTGDLDRLDECFVQVTGRVHAANREVAVLQAGRSRIFDDRPPVVGECLVEVSQVHADESVANTKRCLLIEHEPWNGPGFGLNIEPGLDAALK